MDHELARTLMDDFAAATGVVGDAPSRRYLWTDAYAVCTFLGLARRGGEPRHRELALRLVDLVHHDLGRHRRDDPREGWLSGLDGEAAEQHPTRGGLRIGKPLPERGGDEAPDPRTEWDRDGQYFHYLTRWMRALHACAAATGDARYHAWATELAVTAHRAFTWDAAPGGPRRMIWKASIDLSRPVVATMGQHDPLDGLVTFVELHADQRFVSVDPNGLSRAIADMAAICRGMRFGTDDPLGIGGLLDDTVRLCRLAGARAVDARGLVEELLVACGRSLRAYEATLPQRQPAEERLAFRELGLAIGLRAVERAGRDHERALAALRAHLPLADRIESFWSVDAHRDNAAWRAHRDIDTVMLATSLAPDGYLGEPARDATTRGAQDADR